MAASKADILEALAMLSESSGGLTKKPSVKDVEAILEADITAAERDEAWSEFTTEKTVEVETVKATRKSVKSKEVTNNYTSTIAVCGVTIKSGESKTVDKYVETKCLQRWIEAKVITVK